MITPYLEQLIHEGKASYRTFIAGGSQKCVLNVPNNHYIVIISLGYSFAHKWKTPMIDHSRLLNILETRLTTQMKIISDKSINTFLLREAVNVCCFKQAGDFSEYIVTPQGSQNFDTYSVHDTDVSFTFSHGADLESDLDGETDPLNISFKTPMDYGASGEAGAVSVRKIAKVNLGVTPEPSFIANSGQIDVRLGVNMPKECIFPVNAELVLKNIDGTHTYPVVNVGYVLIQGTANVISST